jgi:hypothetical protein
MTERFSSAQRDALTWLRGDWPDTPGFNGATRSTLVALERRGLVRWVLWDSSETGPRPYWVEPLDPSQWTDHYGPVLTQEGERVAHDVC